MKDMPKRLKKTGRPALLPGDYGYISAYKKRQMIKVIIWAVIIAAVITGGWIAAGTRMNSVTVIGMVLVLPAAKTLIGWIVVARYHTGSCKEYDQIMELAGKNSLVLADIVLTRYEGSMAVNIAVLHGGTVLAYVPKQKTSPEKIREYLTEIKKAAQAEGSVSVYTDFNKFYALVKKLSVSQSKPGKTEETLMKELLSRAV